MILHFSIHISIRLIKNQNQNEWKAYSPLQHN